MQVNYSVSGFLDKNRDTLFEDLKNLCLASEMPLLQKIFSISTSSSTTTAATTQQPPAPMNASKKGFFFFDSFPSNKKVKRKIYFSLKNFKQMIKWNIITNQKNKRNKYIDKRNK